MIESIFKTRTRVMPQFKEGQKVYTDVLITDSLSDNSGNVISKLISSKKVAFDELDVLPDSYDYTLEDLIKSGANIKEVPTHGLLEDPTFDVNTAFVNFVNMVEQSRSDVESKVESNVVIENKEVNI